MRRTIISIIILLTSAICYSQQQKPDTSNYVLVGKMNDWQLLYKSIVTPDDVTTNQKKAISDWINKGLQVLGQPKVDSTKTLPNKTQPKK